MGFLAKVRDGRGVLGLGLIVAMSPACTQYKPQAPLGDKGKSRIGLVPSACAGKKEVFRILDGSKMSWELETIVAGGKGGRFGSTHTVEGHLETVRNHITDSVALVTFRMQDLASGDVTRDRALRDILFSEKGVETFRLVLEKINTTEANVGAGNKKNLSMVAIVEIGGRKAQVIFPATVQEKDGVYDAKGSVEITTRDTRPAVNAISLLDKIEKLEAKLGEKFSNTMRLDMELKLKKDCASY